MKIIVLTAVVGGIDELAEIPAQSIPFERVFITDPALGITGNDRTQALWYKCNALDAAYGTTESRERPDVVIWLDGKIRPLAYDFVEQILTALEGHNIAGIRHHERKCIYQEVDHIEHCMRKGNAYLLARYKDKPLRRQVEAYRYFKYPPNAGLVDCCILAFRDNITTRGILAYWWRDVYKFDGFDQVALPFYARQFGEQIAPIDFKPNSFMYEPHKILK